MGKWQESISNWRNRFWPKYLICRKTEAAMLLLNRAGAEAQILRRVLTEFQSSTGHAYNSLNIRPILSLKLSYRKYKFSTGNWETVYTRVFQTAFLSSSKPRGTDTVLDAAPYLVNLRQLHLQSCWSFNKSRLSGSVLRFWSFNLDLRDRIWERCFQFTES